MYNACACYYTLYHLSLAPDADVSTEPLTDQERQQQSSNTIGNLCIMLACACYYTLYHLSLAPDADVSTKPLTDLERQQQSHNTNGKLLNYNVCARYYIFIIYH